MILISHRGNLFGKNKDFENNPKYILEALSLGYDVEVDVWLKNNLWYLGHDTPEHKINLDFLNNRRLWCHAKNLESLKAMVKEDIHCFWHQNDDYTLTSEGYIWTYPNKQVTDMSIQMCFNGNFEDIHDIAAGVCSDWIGNYK
jgi:hypothetical protein